MAFALDDLQVYFWHSTIPWLYSVQENEMWWNRSRPGAQIWGSIRRERINLNDAYWKIVECRSRPLPLISVLVWCPNVILILGCVLSFFFIITLSFPIFETSSSVLEYAKLIYAYAVKEGVRRATQKQHLSACQHL